jgi:uncharacterized protein YeaO (DUF488 family)
MQIWLRRAYREPGPQDGIRVLVDRIWPRGVRREDLQLDAWLKEISPSENLRRWFDHDPEKWPEFKDRYRAELSERPDGRQALQELRRLAGKGRVTLVFGARETRFNNAVALKEFLEQKCG